jgi:cytochrome c oxidase assembly protein subunit 15
LTFVVGFFAVACFLVALARRQQRVLATLLLLSIPAQAVLGGVTVLTHLNPWFVGLHFLVSAAIILVAFWLWWRTRGVGAAVVVPSATRLLGRLTFVVTAIVLVLGTIVTGAGPHAGSLAEDGTVHRNGLRPGSMAQLHADSVWVLIGASIGLVAVLYAVHADELVRRAGWWLLGIEAAQGVIGYVQYYLHVPALLVAVHMLGACLVWLAVLNVLARVEPCAAGRLGTAQRRT